MMFSCKPIVWLVNRLVNRKQLQVHERNIHSIAATENVHRYMHTYSTHTCEHASTHTLQAHTHNAHTIIAVLT